MNAYLVRGIENKEIVGFFVVPSLADLAYAIDEATDPGLCEAVEVKQGGIFWDKPGTPKIASLDVNEDDDLSGGNFSDMLWSHIHDELADWFPVVTA